MSLLRKGKSVFGVDSNLNIYNVESEKTEDAAQTDMPDQDPLSSHALFELRLFSTCIFVFAALLVQGLLTFYTAFLLKTFEYSIQYRLFTINYLSESATSWTLDQVYLVYASGPLILSVFGYLLLVTLKKITTASWKIKLTMAWMAFLMVNAIPCGLIAGVFFFDSLGVAFQWSVNSFIVRVLIALAVFLILVLFSRYWSRLFIKASYTSVFLKNRKNQKAFLINVYFRPWIYGSVILMFFNWPFYSFFWPASLLSLGYLAISVLNQSKKFSKIHIMKSEKRSFTTRSQILYFVIAIALIWVAGTFRINL